MNIDIDVLPPTLKLVSRKVEQLKRKAKAYRPLTILKVKGDIVVVEPQKSVE